MSTEPGPPGPFIVKLTARQARAVLNVLEANKHLARRFRDGSDQVAVEADVRECEDVILVLRMAMGEARPTT